MYAVEQPAWDPAPGPCEEPPPGRPNRPKASIRQGEVAISLFRARSLLVHSAGFARSARPAVGGAQGRVEAPVELPMFA